MQRIFVTQNSKETQKLGEFLAQEIKGGKVICLDGELGSGKTTFIQGFLGGLKIQGPFTSPTFVVMKEYKLNKKSQKIYHIDAYRVNAESIKDLGWNEIISGSNNIVLIEWAEKIREIIPEKSLRLKFKWLDKDKRKIKIFSK